ncbi:hypothetical protein CVT24_007616 [Panaeolus cyanescens]|uniref:G domain-containing protein n=1 Tax=Panaeolus cyanescens TaxID=181874 RepID=A0A409YKJ5_9AGAR|nr:hypothetical protein CVT24_007616 [Panaeolus cyanescens]
MSSDDWDTENTAGPSSRPLYPNLHFANESGVRVSVRRRVDLDDPHSPDSKAFKRAYKILLIGMTGSGKSTFVESLVPGALDISGNSLDGVTKDLNSYTVTGLRVPYGYPKRNRLGGDPTRTLVDVDLIDTPGFCNPDISEIRIIAMLRDAMTNWDFGINSIILFESVSANMTMRGTKRAAMDIVKALTDVETAPRIIIATTMWDQLTSTKAKMRAREKVNELRKDVDFKLFLDAGSKFIHFENTPHSAWALLDAAILPVHLRRYKVPFEMESWPRDSVSLKCEQPLFLNLVQRIQQLRQEHRLIKDLEDIPLMDSHSHNSAQYKVAANTRLSNITKDARQFGNWHQRYPSSDSDGSATHALGMLDVLLETPQTLVDNPFVPYPAFRNFSIKSGEWVSIQPQSVHVPRERSVFTENYKIILMGVTGSGKSRFIESLAPKELLNISGNSLESVTQSVELYSIAGVTVKSFKIDNKGTELSDIGITLIDTPGFADSDMSEAEVVRKIKAFMNEVRAYVDSIIYFDRISDIRMGSTRKRSMELFKAVTSVATAQHITIATTMWDQLSSPKSVQRAKERFEHLKTGHWKTFLDAGAVLTKFENHQYSALKILNAAVRPFHGRRAFYEIERSPESRVELGYTKLLQTTLMERFKNIQQRLRATRDELSDTANSTHDHSGLHQMLIDEKNRLGLQLYELQVHLCVYGLGPYEKKQSPNVVGVGLGEGDTTVRDHRWPQRFSSLDDPSVIDKAYLLLGSLAPPNLVTEESFMWLFEDERPSDVVGCGEDSTSPLAERDPSYNRNSRHVPLRRLVEKRSCEDLMEPQSRWHGKRKRNSIARPSFQKGFAKIFGFLSRT